MKTKVLFISIIVIAAFFMTVFSVYAGAVLVDGPWYEFLFRGVGVPAEGCSGICAPSPGGNSVYADSPPWTFVAPPDGAKLTIVDVAFSGDIFTIYDFGAEIGTTSFSDTGNFCGFDPDICLQDLNFSQGKFELAEGEHSITIVPLASPFNVGAAYFKVESSSPSINQPPVCVFAEPNSASLWPPNHSFIEITIQGVTDPDGDSVTITIDSIFQDEIVEFIDEDGELTFPDGEGVGTDIAWVRSERNDGDGDDGRFYHIGFTADDGNGGTCSGEVLVGVQRDQSGLLVDGGSLYDSTLVP